MAAIAGSLAIANVATAGDYDYSTPNPENPFYKAHEFSIDAFASGTVGESTIDHLSGSRIERDGRLGAGAGLNYFFTQNIGIGGEAYSENTAHNFIDSIEGNLIARLPLGRTGVAPYIFGGGGRQLDPLYQYFGQAGGGIEFRFAKHMGFFVDARYVLADKTDNFGLGRAGIRINF